ncbi:MAG: hypothetical protein L0K61_01090 [Lactococcus sp.]|nr:hypothetical protein [Lactococcus sp.]
MKKFLNLSVAVLSIALLSACSNAKQTKKNSVSSSSSKIEHKSTPSNSENLSPSKEETGKSEETSKTEEQKTASPLSGYSDEQVEYARVTETIIDYYKYNYQPVTFSVTKHGANHQVFPYEGSVVVPQDTVTLTFSSNNTMAGTTNITYSSNHDGTINFYRDPNHYQDERYLTDPTWVKEESKKILNNVKTIQIPISFDNQAAQIISKIQVK